MFTLKQYIGGKDILYPTEWKSEYINNALELLARVNSLLAHLRCDVTLSSGYRPLSYNKKIGGALYSAHSTCQALDIKDLDGSFKKLITEDLLQQYDLYQESPLSTSTWCHLQTRPTKSGKRIFVP